MGDPDEVVPMDIDASNFSEKSNPDIEFVEQ